jgi:phage baseplate assembly protein gpV
MSKESEKRDKQAQAKPSPARKIVTAVLIVAAFAVVIYLGLRKRGGRLDAFAKCVATKQAKMYGAYWCPHCAEQKEMFESSFQYVPYVECGVPGSRDEAPACKDAGIKHFPTWQFADGERQEGTQTLLTLGAKTGCDLP